MKPERVSDLLPASPDGGSEYSRGEARKDQILEAAADCFRTHGFHGASIARISRSARMSAGHIYHYFENKEAIIAAIVERDLDRLLNLTAEMRSASDVLRAMLERAESGIHDNLDPKIAGLKLEIVAEASRNPRIAEIVQAADRQCLASLADTLRALRRSCGHADDEPRIAGLCELIAAMFEGLMIRSIRNPGLDQQGVTEAFRRVIRELIAEVPSHADPR